MKGLVFTTSAAAAAEVVRRLASVTTATRLPAVVERLVFASSAAVAAKVMKRPAVIVLEVSLFFAHVFLGRHCGAEPCEWAR